MPNYDQQIDDCYCPNGVAHRQEGFVQTLQYAAGFAALLAAYGILKIVAQAVAAVGRFFAAPGVGEGFILTAGGIVAGFWAILILSVWLLTGWHKVKFEGGDWYPVAAVKMFARFVRWVGQQIRVALYQRDLQKRVQQRPEICRKTIAEVLAEMEEHHHAPEKPERIEAYEQAFERVINLN